MAEEHGGEQGAVIRVLIADDHALVRDGIRTILQSQPDIEVVGEAQSGEEAVAGVVKEKPDVILLDIAMPGMNGLDATVAIKEKAPGTRILVLTMHENEEYVLQLFRLGADGYLLKKAAASELMSAIRAVYRGESFLYTGIARTLIDGYRRQAEGAARQEGEDLTEREKEVLHLIVQGHTNREIASLLQLSVKTIQAHRTNIMAKLKVHNSAELVRCSIQRGLVRL